ncbi:MAG: TonB-dependent receptor [Acidobacteriota bacterium]|nr:TonB-dependent receptor [Acidobacteriota bacterium]
MKRQFIPLGLLFTLLVLVSASDVSAQVTTGTIQGLVSDTTGAVMPNAQVSATNIETNFSRNATTDEAGQYSIQFLPPGTYTVEATAPGFKKFLQTGVVVEIYRNARLDPELEPGSVSETVTISSDTTPLVETTSVALGQTVNNQDILNLPLVDRDVYSLLELTAGVDSSVESNAFGSPGRETLVNGGSNAGAGSVNYYLDGGNNTSGLRNTGNVVPNPDAVREFRVITNNYSAEFGRFAGAIVDVVTQSGTNQWHGSAFEFIRNDVLNAAPWPTPGQTSALPKPPIRRNQFGGTLGGPVMKDKTFFFASYAGLRQKEFETNTTAIVFSELERQGDFSQSFDSAGRLRLIRDPLRNSPCSQTNMSGCFPGNKIPTNRLDPVAQRIIADWVPLPNLPGNRYEARAIIPRDSNELQLKIDHQLSEAHQLTGSYFIQKGLTSDSMSGSLPYVTRTFSWKQQNFNLGETWTINPEMINQLRLTYVRNFGGRLNTPEQSLADYGSTFNVQGPPTLPQITTANGFRLGVAIAGPVAGSNLYQGRNVLSITRGRHSLKVGGELSLEKVIHDTTLNSYGVFNFTNSTSRSNTALSDFLLGLPNQVNQDVPIIKQDNNWYMAFFAQDDFKIHPRLTLNLGLRYDFQLPWTDPFDRKVTYVRGAQSTSVPTAPAGLLFAGDAGVPRAVAPIDKNNFAPRVGFAWDPFGDGKTAIRAAYGLFYGTISANQSNATSDGPPFTVRQRLDPVGTLTNPYRNLPGGVSPFPYRFDPANPRFIFPITVSGYALDFALPYTHQINAAVQRQLTRDVSLTVAYVSSLGHHLPFDRDLNYPGLGVSNTTAAINARRRISGTVFGAVRQQAGILNTAYHGLQVTGEKRFSNNISFKGFYTFGKGLEDADLSDDLRGAVQDQDNIRLDRARTNNDRTHNFVLSGIWNIDYFRNRHPLVRTLINGWTVSMITKLGSGLPFTVESGNDNNGDGQTNDRANLVGNPYLDPDRPRSEVVQRWFNTDAFVENSLGRNGTAGRNILDGPGFKIIDIGLFKNFSINERLKLQLRADATNAFNIVNLRNPDSEVDSSTFGQIDQARPMRIIQLGVRLSF